MNLDENLLKTYNDRAIIFRQQEAIFTKRSKLISSCRLVLGIVLLGSLWMFSIYNLSHWLILSSISLVIFITVIILHSKIQKKRLYFHRLAVINEQESSVLTGQDNSLKSGLTYSSIDHPFSYDLDIFGTGSLFQYINRTCTPSGEKRLVENLINSDTETASILIRQEAIKELMPLQDFRQQFMVIGEEVNETPQDLLQLNLWLNSKKSELNNPLNILLSYLMPSVTLMLAVLTIFREITYFYVVFAILSNMAFMQFLKSRINKIHSVVSHKYSILDKYAKLLKHITSQTFTSQSLKSIGKESKDAHLSVIALSKTMSFFDQRLNDLAAIILNGIFLSDLHCIAALDRWKQNHKHEMSLWLDRIFLIDELNSFANFAFNNPAYAYPSFSESVFFDAQNLGHPLIKSSECIKNSFTCSKEEKVIVLTGANMSGKSTFLRALGVNLILAYSGAPVFATKLSCSHAMVYTSMRVTDSLDQDISYFYAELQRLSVIVKGLREGKKMFVILDEILKGTNSDDKLFGSIGLIEEFLQYDCLCIIATHDLALGQLEQKYPKQISNYCFESQLDADRLTFDFTIRPGIAKNKNATFLMRSEGLIK